MQAASVDQVRHEATGAALRAGEVEAAYAASCFASAVATEERKHGQKARTTQKEHSGAIQRWTRAVEAEQSDLATAPTQKQAERHKMERDLVHAQTEARCLQLGV